jgi:hypothetical protein
MKASWTYEVPPAGADASGLEDYQVATREGETAGKVVALLEREHQRYLVFDIGAPPVAPKRRAVAWDDVEEIDHDTLTVRLRLLSQELESAIELDPENEVEGGGADAARVTKLPRELTPSSSPDRGPTDRPTYAGALLLFALGLITLLGLALAASGTDFTWEFALFAVPALLVAGAVLLAYRAYRQPYER